MNQIRLLNSDEIECRVGTISEKGLSLLLYKDARADMKILDETFGAMNWERQHELIGDNLYCTVRIWDENKHQWISKMDVGTESYTEKEKGQASDSFKRACVSVHLQQGYTGIKNCSITIINVGQSGRCLAVQQILFFVG